jgi:hypothetical protein
MKYFIYVFFVFGHFFIFASTPTPSQLNQSQIYNDINEGNYYNSNQNLTPAQLQIKAEGFKEAFDSIFVSNKVSNKESKIYVIVNGQSISPVVSFETFSGGIVRLGVLKKSKVTLKLGTQSSENKKGDIRYETVSAGDIEKLGQW